MAAAAGCTPPPPTTPPRSPPPPHSTSSSQSPSTGSGAYASERPSFARTSYFVYVSTSPCRRVRVSKGPFGLGCSCCGTSTKFTAGALPFMSICGIGNGIAPVNCLLASPPPPPDPLPFPPTPLHNRYPRYGMLGLRHSVLAVVQHSACSCLMALISMQWVQVGTASVCINVCIDAAASWRSFRCSGCRWAQRKGEGRGSKVLVTRGGGRGEQRRMHAGAHNQVYGIMYCDGVRCGDRMCVTKCRLLGSHVTCACCTPVWCLGPCQPPVTYTRSISTPCRLRWRSRPARAWPFYLSC